ncbi:class I SAM-dependent methyltransferase [Ideonella sp. BN130291]|uniref:class I SAM-dependent methyltransferase n=1 Tax=Ideonella sp. BN130291 TaxID=3112940 RepID=UPI002E26F37A|nr:class I SAM-dependent methyltransferase [Ideonella sp. BN130291]
MPVADKPTQLARLIREEAANAVSRLLVVGCGDGTEAAILSRELGCEVIGIDLNPNFDAAARQQVDLRVADACSLPFPDGAFDYVYSYHALEHIPDWRCALNEMDRVLTEGGHYCVGTPNRSRLIGYMGSGAHWKNKLRWNAADWKMRLQGRFRNEFGAHAGFTASELGSALSEAFGSRPVDISVSYYEAIYPRHASTVKLISRMELGRFAWPSVYFIGNKPPAGKIPSFG